MIFDLVKIILEVVYLVTPLPCLSDEEYLEILPWNPVSQVAAYKEDYRGTTLCTIIYRASEIPPWAKNWAPTVVTYGISTQGKVVTFTEQQSYID